MADISKITIPSGSGTATYNLKDVNAFHSITPSTVTIVPISCVGSYTTSVLGTTALTPVGESQTDFSLDLTGVLNGLSATSQTVATINNLTPSGQVVVIGITAF